MGDRREWFSLLLLLLALNGCGEQRTPVRPLAAQLDAQLPELEQRLAALHNANTPPALAEMINRQDAALNRAKTSPDPLVELYRLREPLADIHALGFLAEHQSSVDTQEQLERVWRDSAPLFEERRDLPANRLQRAMIQAAQNKADVLREASLAYGQITSPESGLYYLGEAVGQARLASFLRGLEMEGPQRGELALSGSAVARGLAEVDGLALAVFETEPTGGAAIPISARLKEARALLDRGAIDGAALVLLESRLAAAQQNRGGEPASAPPQEMNDPIETLFVRLAEDDEERSELIAGVVLPFYASMLHALPADNTAEHAAPVVVTLVRWPYT